MNNSLNHIGIILDGNGRYGLKCYNSRTVGHQIGIDNLKKMIPVIMNLEINHLSLYLLSSDNFKRDKVEIDNLLKHLYSFMKYDCAKYQKESINIFVIGSKDRLPTKLVNIIKERASYNLPTNKKNMYLLIDYDALNEFKDNVLDSNFLPNIDLVIRTGGKKRLSGFLPYESRYAELYFTDTLWPEFKEDELNMAITWYKDTTRNFGGT